MLKVGGKHRRVYNLEWTIHPGHTFHHLQHHHLLVLLKLDLTERRQLYIMNHTVTAALALLYLLLTSLCPRQVGT